MSEFAPPSVVGNDAPSAPWPALGAEAIDAVLSDFRSWLEALPSAAVVTEEPPPIDLYTLVAQFTALRQEVNLQTRTARSQQDLQAQALEQLKLASQHWAAARSTLSSDAETLLRPLVQSLIDAADAQYLAVREVARVVETVVQALADTKDIQNAPVPDPPRLGWLARLCGAGRVVEQQRQLLVHLEERLAAVRPAELAPVEAVVGPLQGAFAGLQMGLQRLDRALERNDITPIPTVGRPFDPEQMEVLEGVPGTGLPAGQVVEELRRGYIWNGRLFRYAQVRVAR